MTEFLPDIIGRVIEKDGIEAVLPLSDTDKYAREFSESDVKRGGDSEHPGRFSSKGGAGAKKKEQPEEPDDPEAVAAGQEQVGSPEQRREELLKANIGIPRHDMPQIIGIEDTSEFVQSLSEQGIEVAEVQIPVGQLKGTQSELNMEKVAGMVGAIQSGAWNPSEGGEPVLASSDGYILDGHHRWAAQRIVDPNSSMTLLQANLPIRDLLDEAHSFDDVQYAGVKDKEPVESPEILESKARVYSDNDPETEAAFYKSTGLTADSFANLTGAPDGAYVSVYFDDYSQEGLGRISENQWRVRVSVSEGEEEQTGEVKYQAERDFRWDGAEWSVHNENFSVHKNLHGQGIGTRMLSKQVEFCRRLGIKYIQTTAAGSAIYEKAGHAEPDIGYKVWPKLGYEANVPAFRLTAGYQETVRSTSSPNPVEISNDPLPQEVLDKICPEGKGCGPQDYVPIHSILKHKAGQEWWDKNGFGLAARFDTSEDSQSSKILNKYIRRKRAAGKFAESYQRSEKMPADNPRGETPDLSLEELADLAEMWNEMEEDEYTTTESQEN